ncbi:MAG: HAD-superfamily hydrolase, subfamily IA, variant 3 [Parcubacteria group bacterium GW2011_GWA2_38_13]|nr:MAG: HAD-superfamily hydrolase, subfamily IA, variant 3 [Parcubacteria group bacterium GW2011_GWA2_38_13]
MIKAIIFDFGGIFNIRDSLKIFWQDNADTLKVDPEKAFAISLPLWRKARIGNIDSEIFWEKLGACAKMSPENFKKYFIEYTGYREEMLEYIKKNLKGKYKLAILSNQIKTWIEPILKEKKFEEVFDVIITSYNTGFAKPDIRIYKKAIQALGVKAQECIYIEDKPRNVGPAEALGMKVILFQSYDQCINDLNNLLI